MREAGGARPQQVPGGPPGLYGYAIALISIRRCVWCKTLCGSYDPRIRSAARTFSLTENCYRFPITPRSHLS